MRNCLILIAISVAVSISVLVGGAGTATAKALAYCDPAYNPQYAGVGNASNTGVGVDATAAIKLNSDNVYGGSVRAYITVHTNMQQDTLTVGIRDTGAGPKLYFENSGVTVNTWDVNYGQFYTVSISHDSTHVYTAHWGTHSYTATLGPDIFDETDWFAQSSNPGTQCNAMDFVFHNLGPWTISHMGGLENVSSAYTATKQSEYAFEVQGP